MSFHYTQMTKNNTHPLMSIFEGPGEADEESYKVMCVGSAVLDESVVPHP